MVRFVEVCKVGVCEFKKWFFLIVVLNESGK